MYTSNREGRVARKRAQTRQTIVDVATRLFRSVGYDTVTMEQIAKEADIAKATLYSHFPVKDAILADMVEQESLARNTDRIVRMEALPDTRARLTASLTELLGAIKARPEVFETYFTYRTKQMISLAREPRRAEGLRLLGQHMIRMGQEQGELRRDLPPELLEALFEFCFITVAQRYYESRKLADAKRAVVSCVEIFMHGAAAAS